MMRLFFMPATWLMSRLRYAYKFLLIGVLLLAPFNYVTYLLIKAQEEQIKFNQKESYGVAYITQAWALLGGLQDWRTHALAALAGHGASNGELELLRKDLETLIPLIDRVNAQSRKSFQANDGREPCAQRWNEIKGELEKIQRRSFHNQEECFQAYTELCSLVCDWILNDAANYSNLILDPDLDSYWLMDAFVAKLPDTTEALAKACALAIGYADARAALLLEHPLTDTRREAPFGLSILTVQIRERLHALVSINLKTAYEYNNSRSGRLQARIEPAAQDALRRSQEFLELLTRGQEASEAKETWIPKLIQGSQKALEAQRALYRAMGPELDALILARVAGYERDERLGVIAASGATLLLIYIFVGFFLSVKSSIARLGEFTRRMIAGTQERFTLVTGDELGQVAESYNLINAALNETRSLKSQIERKREELGASEVRFRQLSEKAPIGILQWDAHGECIYVNSRWEAIVGMKRDACRQQGWLKAVHPESIASVRESWERATRDRSAFNEEIRVVDSQQTVHWVHAHATPLASDQGGHAGFVGTMEDITERKKAEVEQSFLEIQTRQAQKLESIGQLAAGIAHEINTPTQYIGDNLRFLVDAFDGLQKAVAGLQGAVRDVDGASGPSTIEDRVDAVLKESDLEYLMAEVPKAISQSLEGNERVAEIVKAMKAFSHPGKAEKEAIDLNQAIETTLTVARNEWKYVADAVTDLDPRMPLVPCLPGELHSVFLNLIVNAAHAINDVVKQGLVQKGTIRIQTRHEDDWAEIRIEDTGTGIPEHVRPKIFEPFFTTKGVGKGTGQGLALSHAIVTKRHGGTIRFETEAGKGTAFIIRLPLEAKLAAVVNA